MRYDAHHEATPAQHPTRARTTATQTAGVASAAAARKETMTTPTIRQPRKQIEIVLYAAAVASRRIRPPRRLPQPGRHRLRRRPTAEFERAVMRVGLVFGGAR